MVDEQLIIKKMINVWSIAVNFGEPFQDIDQSANNLLRHGILKGYYYCARAKGKISDRLRVINRVDSKFASLGYDRIVRGELFPFKICTNTIPEEHRIKNNIPEFLPVKAFIIMHKGGSMVFSIHLDIIDENGFDIETAVELSRLGVYEVGQSMYVPGTYSDIHEFQVPNTILKINNQKNKTIKKIGEKEPEMRKTKDSYSLKSFVNSFILPLISKTLKTNNKNSIHYPIQNTMSFIFETAPLCQNKLDFIKKNKDLLSIPTMDKWWIVRDKDIVAESLKKDYSIDKEISYFVLPDSGLFIIEKDEIMKIWVNRGQIEYKLDYLCDVLTDIFQHYHLFVEWNLIERSTFLAYIKIFTFYLEAPPKRKTIVNTRRHMIRDLEVYEEGITEFLYGNIILNALRERHGLEKLHARLQEKKDIVEQIISERHAIILEKLLLGLNLIIILSLAMEMSNFIKTVFVEGVKTYKWYILNLSPIGIGILSILFIIFLLFILEKPRKKRKKGN